ncbi:MAG: reverse transcriptase family protein, partial [Maribacter sp.]|nr:reverse transcriptase family protein [Maribacter sp.]
LNEYFTSVFTVDNGKLPHFDINRINEPLPVIDFSPHIVYRYLENQPLKLSAGPDSLLSKLFNKLSVPLAEPLSYIYQFSYVTEQLPECWLKADVIPIFKKKGSPSSPAGYRPISLTCIACKIMEGIISEQLTDYLARNNVITQSQHGFVRKKSTVTQMLECLNDWTQAIAEDKVVDVIYLDLAKAFDSVSHPKLISKLRMYGIE